MLPGVQVRSYELNYTVSQPVTSIYLFIFRINKQQSEQQKELHGSCRIKKCRFFLLIFDLKNYQLILPDNQ